MKNANDIELLEKALHYKINGVLQKRIKKIVLESDEEDKVNAGIQYGYSIGRVK